ncbi:mucin-19-like [Sycon ciliatum]|uniref:mucin-19-like n=1 Tax=Sycon ciliatum TaxID=27933 RepID=UPI0031F6B60F
MSSIFASGCDELKVWSLSNISNSLSSVKTKHQISDLIWLSGGHHIVHCEAETGHLSCGKFSSGSGLSSSTKTFSSLPCGTCRLAALRSSSHFLAAGVDHVVRLVSVSDSTVQRTFTGHTAPVQSIAASCSDTALAVALDDAQVVVHRLSGAASTTRFTVPGCQAVWRLRFSNHTDPLLACVGDGGRTVVWDVATNLPQATFSAHRADSIVKDVSFSPRNPLLMVTAGEDRQLVFHDVPKKILIRSFQCASELCSAAILHDGFTVVAGTINGDILLYDLRAGDKLKERISAHSSPVSVLVARSSSTGSSGGSARRSKSGSASSAASNGRTKAVGRAPTSATLSERPEDGGASTKAASEASPSLPTLASLRPDPKQQTPTLDAQEPRSLLSATLLSSMTSADTGASQHHSAVSHPGSGSSVLLHSGSRPVVTSINPSPISSVGFSTTASTVTAPMAGMDAIGAHLGPAPGSSGVVAIGSPALSSSERDRNATAVRTQQRTGAAPAKPAAVNLTSLGEGDIFSPLKTAPPSGQASDRNHLASSPSLPQPSALLGTSSRRAIAAASATHRPSPLATLSNRDVNWSSAASAAPASRSLQQAEGMETTTSSAGSGGRSMPVSAVSTSISSSVLSSSQQQQQHRYSPHSANTALNTSSQYFQRASHAPASAPAAASASSSTSAGLGSVGSGGGSADSRYLFQRDTIDGSEGSPTARSATQAPATSAQSLSHRHILGAARSALAAGSSSTPASLLASAGIASHSASNTAGATSSAAAAGIASHTTSSSSVQAIASALDQLVSPTKSSTSSSRTPIDHPRALSQAPMPASSAVTAGSMISPDANAPLHSAMLQHMIDQSVDELRLAVHQHIRNVHVNLIRQIGDQTAELLAAQSQQYEATDALLMEMQFLREEIRRLQERY